MKKIYLLFALFVFLTYNVSSFMPPTHKFINKQLENLNLDTQLYIDCMADPELCYAGNLMADVSVLFYYTEGNKYVATHNPIFCQSLLQQASGTAEKACAVGGCIHQTQDVQSHNEMVTYSIKHTGLANAIIHTFAEQHLDNIVQERDPTVRELGLNPERWEECVPLFKKVLAGTDAFKEESESGEIDGIFDKFMDEVSGSVTSYDSAFRKKGGLFDNLRVLPFSVLAIYVASFSLWLVLLVLLIFKRDKRIFNYFSIVILIGLVFFQGWLFVANLQGNAFITFVKFISPFSNLVPIGDPDTHLNNAVNNGKRFFIDGERSLINSDASGFVNLKKADKSVLLIDYGVLAIILLILVLFIKANFKGGFRRNQEISTFL